MSAGAGVYEVPLTNGGIAVVDEEDRELVANYRWNWKSAPRARYAQASYQQDGRQIMMLLHRLILDAPHGIEVDHLNGNGLDNRRKNLRLATRQQNGANRRKQRGATSSKFKGVYLTKPAGTWQAVITVSGKHEWLGRYRLEEEAALAYDAAAKAHFGSYAALNLPDHTGPVPQRLPVGSQPKLTPEQIADARAKYEGGGVIWRDLAACYGVGERTLRRATKQASPPPTVFSSNRVESSQKEAMNER